MTSWKLTSPLIASLVKFANCFLASWILIIIPFLFILKGDEKMKENKEIDIKKIAIKLKELQLREIKKQDIK